MALKQIQITRTKGEWDLIVKKLVPPNKKKHECISHHIRREVLKLNARLTELPETFVYVKGEVDTRRFYIDETIIKDIEHIATTLKLSPQIIIDRLIITPLLQSQP